MVRLKYNIIYLFVIQTYVTTSANSDPYESYELCMSHDSAYSESYMVTDKNSAESESYSYWCHLCEQ